MQQEPLHPIVRLIVGDIDELQIQYIEHLIGPLRGSRANFTLLTIGLPPFIAGAALVYYDAFGYLSYFLAAPLLYFMIRVYMRHRDM